MKYFFSLIYLILYLKLIKTENYIKINDKFLNEQESDFKFLKIGHLSDIHLKLNYNKWSPDNFCESITNKNQTDPS